MKLIFAILLTTLSIVNARLGETFEQCVTRYGQSELKADSARWTIDGIIIKINFLQGKAACVNYFNVASLEDAQDILKKNGQGWEKEAIKTVHLWAHPQKHQATFASTLLTIKTEAWQKKEAADDQRKLNKF